jgi:hypothetical protein
MGFDFYASYNEVDRVIKPTVVNVDLPRIPHTHISSRW